MVFKSSISRFETLIEAGRDAAAVEPDTDLGSGTAAGSLAARACDIAGGGAAAASFSRVAVLSAIGLFGCGDKISFSCFIGDSARAGVLFPVPACESADGRLRPIIGVRPLALLVCEILPLDATDDIEACRRDAGTAGGGIDVLWELIEVRVRAPAEGTLAALDGVPVLETVVLDAALSGLVGDLAGD